MQTFFVYVTYYSVRMIQYVRILPLLFSVRVVDAWSKIAPVAKFIVPYWGIKVTME
jgi:hypothetical protein